YTRYLSDGIIYEDGQPTEDVSIGTPYQDDEDNDYNQNCSFMFKKNKRCSRVKNALVSMVRKNYTRIKEYVKANVR
ncbi:MAG TPA: hypothetical protein VHD33_07455, partial [Legionellaceae bacterium]|nr:hypothetical protein [Legionellaceae bacterium]